jgi:hypothetical protein
MKNRTKTGNRHLKTGIILLAVMAAFFTQALWAAPKPEQSKVKAGDCAGCHIKEKVLPEEHAATKEMNSDACQACHAKDTMNLTGKMSGSHGHQLAGINCEKCHGKTKKPEALTMEQCVACHGSTDKLAEKTKDVQPVNPHTSPHYGTTLDCNLCHHQHVKSENFCSQCHKFDFKVP